MFIIIAAVLGVGGVVSASIYSLVGSAAANSSISIVGASVKAGQSVGAPPIAIAVSIKNNGGSPISCATPASCEVVFAGTDVGSTPSCSAPCSIISGGSETWTLQTSAGPLTFVAESAGSLAPGAEASFVLNGAISTAAGSFWTPGSTVTINALFGSASSQVTVVSE